MKARLKNIAVTGITTIDEFLEICKRIEGSDFKEEQNPSYLTRKNYQVFYTEIATNSFYNWPYRDYNHCTLYTVAQFHKKFMTRKLSFRTLTIKD